MLQALIVYVLALVVFVWLLQLALFAYGRGVVRAAIDEGARAGSVVDDAVARCEQRAAQALGGLLGGRMGEDVSIVCSDDGERVLARAQVRFVSIAPGPDWTFDITATARRTALP